MTLALRRVMRAVKSRVRPSIAARNVIEMSRLVRSGERLVFVSSYPRSGNTWIRYILSDCFLRAAGIETTTDLPVHPDSIIPALNSNLIVERDPIVVEHGLFVKTHDRIDELTDLFGAKAINRARFVFVFRSPADFLVSYYHFHLRYPHLVRHAADGIDSFCLTHVFEWVAHTTTYLDARRTDPDRFHVIGYESLLSEPVVILEGLIHWLDLKIDGDNIERAVRNTEFGKLQAQEATQPQNSEEFFFRKGRSGSGREELLPSTNEEIDRRTEAVFRRLHAVVAEQLRDHRLRSNG